MANALRPLGPSAPDPFAHAGYTLVKPMFSWRGVIRVFGADGRLAAFVEQPWFRLRTELIMYADEEQLQPILILKTRRLAALNVEHDVFDAMSGRRLGCIRARGLRAIFRDAWDILDAEDRIAGEMVEAGGWFWRRVLPFLPGRHHIALGGREVARITQIYHFFRREFALDLLPVDDPVEPRFAIACALIAMLADLRRENKR
jgi:hypothetical protein